MTEFSLKLWALCLALGLQVITLSCGARTAPYVEPRVLPPPVQPACPATIFARVGQEVEVRVTPVPDTPDVEVLWSLEYAPIPNAPTPREIARTRTTYTFTSAMAREISVIFFQRRPGRPDERMNNEGRCVTRVIFQPDVLLTCAPSQSGLLGTTLPLRATARSLSDRPLTARWNVLTRPVGAGLVSTSVPSPIDRAESSLLLDERGNYTLDLEVRNDVGEEAHCRMNILSSAEVAVRCPDDVRTTSLQNITLNPVEILNPRNLELSFNAGWSQLASRTFMSHREFPHTQSRDVTFLLDVQDQWNLEFRVSLVGANQHANCGMKVSAYHDDDIHIELGWNVYGPCEHCGPLEGGQHVSLQLTNATANNGVFPGQYQCIREGCSCVEGDGTQCAANLVDWPPAGPINDPRLVFATGCTRPGPEHIAVHRAQPGTEFDLAALYDEACRSEVRQGRDPVQAIVRVFCGGQLRYETESQVIPYAFTEPGEPRDFAAWRIGRIRYNEDGSCTMTRRCPDGQPQTACIGRTRDLYESR